LKKLYSLILLSLTLTLSSGFSQMRYGVTVGLNSSYVEGDYEYASKKGSNFGVFLEKKYNPYIDIVGEVGLTKKGFLNDSDYYWLSDEEVINYFNYIQANMLLKLKMPGGQGPLRPNLFVGPYFSILTLAESEIYQNNRRDYYEIQDMRGYDFGVILGFGLDIPFGPIRPNVSLRYESGVKDINEDIDVKLKNKSISFVLQLGI